MSTRAASASTSRRAKQELVRLLFGHEATSSSSSVLCRSQKLDHAAYTYNDLRSAYLEQLQKLHPDKHRFDPNYATKHSLFVELQEAWDNYESIAKMAKKIDAGNDDKVRDFTMFGVGCSFSDNDAEREWRSEITDQACRGWFSSGSLAEFSQTGKSTNDDGSTPSTKQESSLLQDDMFVAEEEAEEDSDQPERKNSEAPRRRSLVDFGPRSRSSFR